MNLNFLPVLVPGLVSIFVVACQKPAGGPPAGGPANAGIDSHAIVGSWEVDGTLQGGNVVAPSKAERINEAGYLLKANAIQYKITDTHFTALHHDGVAGEIRVDDDYKIAGNQLVTLNTAKGPFGFSVLSVDDNGMTVQPSGDSEDSKTILHLQRIDEKKLAISALPKFTQSIGVDLQQREGLASFSQTIKSFRSEIGGISPLLAPVGPANAASDVINCSFVKGVSPSFQLNAKLGKNPAEIAASDREQMLKLEADILFDFAKSHEAIDFKLGADKTSHFSLVVFGVADETHVSISEVSNRTDDRTATCSMHLEREERELSMTLSCANVKSLNYASDPKAAPVQVISASVELKAQCILMFPKKAAATPGKSK